MYFHSPLLVVSLQFTEVCGVARGDIVWRTTVEEPRKDTGDLAFRSKVKSQKSKVKSTVVLAGDGTETRRANVKPSSLRAKPNNSLRDPNNVGMSQKKGNVLREPQFNMMRPWASLEQMPICTRLLHHFRVQSIPRRKSVLPEAIVLHNSSR